MKEYTNAGMADQMLAPTRTAIKDGHERHIGLVFKDRDIVRARTFWVSAAGALCSSGVQTEKEWARCYDNYLSR